MVEVFVDACRVDPQSWVEPVIVGRPREMTVDTERIRTLIESTDSYLELSDAEMARFDDAEREDI